MSVRDHQPPRPRPGQRHQLITGAWAVRRVDAEPFQVRNVSRHARTVQLVSDMPGSDPFTVSFDDFDRGYRLVAS